MQLSELACAQSSREEAARGSEQAREIGRLERSLKQATAAGERQLLTLQKVNNYYVI